MVQYKIHTIANSNSVYPVVGLTIPKEVAQFFSGCYFKIEIKKVNGNYGIYCISGTLNIPTEKEVSKYQFEDCRI
jgi:predicted membrane-bound dolichyl-phosphate-mannose-protein mannosyltransferase